MEAKTPFSIKFTTACVSLLTLLMVALLMTEEISRLTTVIIGTLLLGCLGFFAGILTKLGAVERQRRVFYEIK